MKKKSKIYEPHCSMVVAPLPAVVLPVAASPVDVKHEHLNVSLIMQM